MKVFTRFFSASVKSLLKTNPIENNFKANELKIKLNGNFATVTYKRIDNTTYDLLHASIPEEYQGQGLGSVFAKRIFDHLEQNNKKIKVSCEYLQKFLKNNEDKYKHNIVN